MPEGTQDYEGAHAGVAGFGGSPEEKKPTLVGARGFRSRSVEEEKFWFELCLQGTFRCWDSLLSRSASSENRHKLAVERWSKSRMPYRKEWDLCVRGLIFVVCDGTRIHLEHLRGENILRPSQLYVAFLDVLWADRCTLGRVETLTKREKIGEDQVNDKTTLISRTPQSFWDRIVTQKFSASKIGIELRILCTDVGQVTLLFSFVPRTALKLFRGHSRQPRGFQSCGPKRTCELLRIEYREKMNISKLQELPGNITVLETRFLIENKLETISAAYDPRSQGHHGSSNVAPNPMQSVKRYSVGHGDMYIPVNMPRHLSIENSQPVVCHTKFESTAGPVIVHRTPTLRALSPLSEEDQRNCGSFKIGQPDICREQFSFQNHRSSVRPRDLTLIGVVGFLPIELLDVREKARQSATGRCCVATSRSSPSRQSAGWPGAEQRSAPRAELKVFWENVIRDAVTYTEQAKRKSVPAMVIVCTLKRQGRTLCGFGERKFTTCKQVQEKFKSHERNLLIVKLPCSPALSKSFHSQFSCSKDPN
ncbi:hypothetical protein PR048_014302 [Dryococelus australis]|uniref:Histone H4 n=1 Tax=Dryococelus australis TaxID=614101 RepID=A0ABQ9HDW4_9NEOP|nr:hypothetical protein PR048_014302 [Dryococelus australis]